MQQICNASAQSHSAQAIYPAEKFQVLPHAETAVQGKFLRHIAEVFTRLGPCRAQIHSCHSQHAAACGKQAAQHAEGSRLARAVGAEQAEQLAPAHAETGVVHGHKISKAAHQIAYLYHLFPPCLLKVPAGRGRRNGAFRFRGINIPRFIEFFSLFPQDGHESILQSCGRGNSVKPAAAPGFFQRLCFCILARFGISGV